MSIVRCVVCSLPVTRWGREVESNRWACSWHCETQHTRAAPPAAPRPERVEREHARAQPPRDVRPNDVDTGGLAIVVEGWRCRPCRRCRRGRCDAERMDARGAVARSCAELR